MFLSPLTEKITAVPLSCLRLPLRFLRHLSYFIPLSVLSLSLSRCLLLSRALSLSRCRLSALSLVAFSHNQVPVPVYFCWPRSWSSPRLRTSMQRREQVTAPRSSTFMVTSCQLGEEATAEMYINEMFTFNHPM
jgi:hypothetical protein